MSAHITLVFGTGEVVGLLIGWMVGTFVSAFVEQAWKSRRKAQGKWVP